MVHTNVHDGGLHDDVWNNCQGLLLEPALEPYKQIEYPFAKLSPLKNVTCGCMQGFGEEELTDHLAVLMGEHAAAIRVKKASWI